MKAKSKSSHSNKSAKGERFVERNLVPVNPLREQFEPTPANPVRAHFRMAGGGK